MSGVAIYMEGGGDGGAAKAALRQGMDAFLAPLKEVAQQKRWRWKLVPCGGRDDAFRAFRDARNHGDMSVVVLLVDAEDEVTSAPCAHLHARDKWDLTGIGDDVVYLMIRTMETWIVADPDALRSYYGRHFKFVLLPRAVDLESVTKTEIASALDRATRDTRKGTYQKIRHASDLLRRIDREKVRQRCASCARLFDTIGKMVG